MPKDFSSLPGNMYSEKKYMHLQVLKIEQQYNKTNVSDNMLKTCEMH